MWKLLDILFYLIHFVIIGFNLLGWIWHKTRKWHLIVAGVTLFCWLIIGIWYGFGYCPITDWQWQIKSHLGQTNLPASFVEHAIDKFLPVNISSYAADLITAITFSLAIVISLWLNIKDRFNQKSD